jgi:hypothetical protein
MRGKGNGMATAWIVPRTWSDDEVPSAGGTGGFNSQIRDNMTHLKHPPYGEIVTGITGLATVVISGSGSTAIPITAGVSATLTAYGGDVECYFRARVTSNIAVTMIFNLQYNGTAYTDLVSGLGRWVGNDNTFAHYNVWLTGLASGVYTFMPTWEQPGGGTMLIDASSSPLIFWAREG